VQDLTQNIYVVKLYDQPAPMTFDRADSYYDRPKPILRDTDRGIRGDMEACELTATWRPRRGKLYYCIASIGLHGPL
jgi:hypothetical protein